MFGITVTSFSALMLYAALSDLRSYTLPNWISLVLIAGFAVMAMVIQPPLTTVGWHLLIAAGFFIIGLALFATNIFGGGDVKVIAALGLWFGPNSAFPFLFWMSIAGGAFALLIILFRLCPLPKRLLKFRSIADLHNSENGMPYGVAIAIAALIEFPNTEIYSALAAL